MKQKVQDQHDGKRQIKTRADRRRKNKGKAKAKTAAGGDHVGDADEGDEDAGGGTADATMTPRESGDDANMTGAASSVVATSSAGQQAGPMESGPQEFKSWLPE